LRAFKHAEQIWRTAEEERKKLEEAERIKAEEEANKEAA
jgi:hypothetical protein